MKGLSPELRKRLKQHDKRLPKAIEAIYKADGKDHKYGAIKTTCLYKHDHDSRKEAMHCVKLHELQKEGKIYNLIREPMIVLAINGQIICNHYPDFFYTITLSNQKCFCDVKGDWAGGKRPEWIIKRKMCEALYQDHEYVVV